MRVIVFLVVAVVQSAAGAFGFLMLLLGLNGFSEREATPGLGLYIVLGVGSALGLGLAAALAAGWLVTRKQMGGFGAAVIAVAGSSVVGVAVLFAGFLAAVMLASFMHGSR